MPGFNKGALHYVLYVFYCRNLNLLILFYVGNYLFGNVLGLFIIISPVGLGCLEDCIAFLP